MAERQLEISVISPCFGELRMLLVINEFTVLLLVLLHDRLPSHTGAGSIYSARRESAV